MLWITFVIPFVLVAAAGCAWIYGRCNPEKVLASDVKVASKNFRIIEHSHDVAILIACYRGEGTIGNTVKAALQTGCDVYVVDDGSKQLKPGDPRHRRDMTSEVAHAAGAQVVELTENVGKPAALLEAYRQLDLSGRYPAVAILDDDVTIEANFVVESLKLFTPEVAIVVGKNLTWWPEEKRKNVWLANRAFSYWNYQLIIRRLQSFFGVMNCISGSNSVYRTELLDEVLTQKPPYIVDDTYWVLEAQRRKLGEIVYAPDARAHLQDPTTFKEWYKQNLRWLWGTFQGIIGHRVGRSWSRFDFAYLLLILQWVLYIATAPISIYLAVTVYFHAPMYLLLFAAGFVVWVTAAAIQLRRPRLVLFIPAIIVTDLIYRVIFVHALVKALRQPTVDNCVWDSPTRIAISN